MSFDAALADVAAHAAVLGQAAGRIERRGRSDAGSVGRERQG
jgi:hypothetical protein